MVSSYGAELTKDGWSLSPEGIAPGTLGESHKGERRHVSEARLFRWSTCDVLTDLLVICALRRYAREKEEILTFIADAQIPGVVLMTGDAHFCSAINVQARYSAARFVPSTCSPVCDRIP